MLTKMVSIVPVFDESVYKSLKLLAKVKKNMIALLLLM
jgi:hypothetical protein